MDDIGQEADDFTAYLANQRCHFFHIFSIGFDPFALGLAPVGINEGVNFLPQHAAKRGKDGFLGEKREVYDGFDVVGAKRSYDKIHCLLLA